MTALLETSGVRKAYGDFVALDQVTLSIADGELVSIVGPNGAGKTTLLKTILGLTRSDGGAIVVDGERVDDDPMYRTRLGYMPQIARFPENLSAAELIAMLRDLRGNDESLDDDLIARFTLDDQLRKPLRTLSGGTRQKVNAVLAFLFRPEFLVLDEPTAGLDPVSSGVLKEKIAEVREAGRTVIVTSHILSELDAIADDIAFLVDGRLRYSGSIHDLKLATRQLDLERAVAHVMTEDAVA